MQPDKSIDEPPMEKSFLGLNISYISNDNSKIIKAKFQLNDQSQQIKSQQKNHVIATEAQLEENHKKIDNQSMNQSSMLSVMSALDDSRNYDINENSVSYNNSPLDKTTNQSQSEINLSGGLLNESNNEFRLITNHSKLYQNKEQAIIKIQPLTKDLSAIQTKIIIDNSISNDNIKKYLLDQIPINHQYSQNSKIIQNITIPNQTNNQPQNINSQPTNIQKKDQSSQQQICYDDGMLDVTGKIFSQNRIKEKKQAFQKRKLIKQKQQSICQKVLHSQKKQSQKKMIQKDQKPKPKSKTQVLSQINQQNLNVLKKMFNSNLNVIRKKIRGLSSLYYNVFYIDQTLPAHNRYILYLSINVDKKDVQFLKPRKSDLQKKKTKRCNKKKAKIQYKIINHQKNKNYQTPNNKIFKLQSQKQQTNREENMLKKEIVNKLIKENNRKGQNSKKLRKRKDIALNKQGYLKIKMDLLTSVTWQRIVYLEMKRSRIDDQTFKIFVDNADKFPNLMRIQFSENLIQDEGFIYFVENSDKFINLFDIFLEQNKITNKGLKALSNEQLNFMFYKRIRISENLIDDEGYEYFFSKGENHPNLLQIKFDGNPKNYKKLMTCKSLETFANNIYSFKQLREVHFLNNSIKDYGLKKFTDKLHELDLLAQINFGINHITSKGFEYFLNKINNSQCKTFIKKLHFNRNKIEKIPQNKINYLIGDKDSKLLLLNLKQNPLQQDQDSCLFLADIFFNMKLKFNLQVFLNTPYTLNLKNMKYSFQREIQIINGDDSGVINPMNNESTRNQTQIQEINDNKTTKKKLNQIRFRRLSQLNLSSKQLNSQCWSLIVQNINSLPQLQNLILDENKIEIIKFQQLKNLQESVSKRTRIQSRILKITLINNKLNEQSIKTLNKFIQNIENRVVFFVVIPQKSEKNYQQIYKDNLMEEKRKYQQKYFEIKIHSSLQFGTRELTISKEIKDIKFFLRFQKMFKQIVSYCKNQVSCYQKVKSMFLDFEKSIKSGREYKTKKDQIDRVWKIIKDFCFDLIDEWCKNLQHGIYLFNLSYQSIKSLFKEISQIKKKKSEIQKKNEN